MAINKTDLENSFLVRTPFVFSVVSLITLAIFSGILTADFVMWDDDIGIT